MHVLGLYVAVYALCSSSVYAGTVIHKEGGVYVPSLGRVGYYTVQVIRDGDETSIYCGSPGHEECPDKMIASGPGRPADDHTTVEDAGINFAHAQIANGTLSGNTQFTLSGYSPVKRLVWSVNSQQQLSGCIRIWTDGDPDPGCN